MEGILLLWWGLLLLQNHHTRHLILVGKGDITAPKECQKAKTKDPSATALLALHYLSTHDMYRYSLLPWSPFSFPRTILGFPSCSFGSFLPWPFPCCCLPLLLLLTIPCHQIITG